MAAGKRALAGEGRAAQRRRRRRDSPRSRLTCVTGSGMKEIASIEPKPGVPPSAGYLAELVTKLAATPPKMILRNAYNDPRAADWLARRIMRRSCCLPYSVGGTLEAKGPFRSIR